MTVTNDDLGESVGPALPAWTDFTPTMTAASGTWTGGSAISARYLATGKLLIVSVYINASSVSATPAYLQIVIPGSYTSKNSMLGAGWASDNSTSKSMFWNVSSTPVGGANTKLRFYIDPTGGTSWAASSSATALSCVAILEVV